MMNEKQEERAVSRPSWHIPPIELSVDVAFPPQTLTPSEASFLPGVEDRYYQKYTTRTPDPSANVQLKESGPQCVLVHSNRVCLVTLGWSHPVVKEKMAVSKVNFQVTERLNRLSNSVRGKGKKGGQNVDEKAILAWIECANGDKFAVRSHVRGKLIEMNERLSTDPELIVRRPETEGFVAIVQPKIPEGLDDLRRRLVLQE